MKVGMCGEMNFIFSEVVRIEEKLRLVREATRRIKCFNPRTREGCDVSRCTTPPTMPRFQSTHP